MMLLYKKKKIKGTEMNMKLNWGMCQGDVWCSFQTVNLEHPTFINAQGVYIIWSGEITVKVGGGSVKSLLLIDRNDPTINSFPNLKISWAEVPVANIEGVKNYITNRLNPRIPNTPNNAQPIEVNLPWW